MDKEKVAAAFNEWMRRYVNEPEKFAAEFRTVGMYLVQAALGKEPTYGETCAEYLFQLMGESA